MACRKRLERLFREEGVRFSVSKHDETYSAQRLAAELHIPGRQLAKVVMVKANDELAMLVLSAPDRVDLDKVRRAVKADRVQLAAEQDFAPCFPDCEVGAMPPFGNLYEMNVYVDRPLSTQNQIAFPAGTHREIMQVAYSDFERIVEPVLADLSRG
jgi:Ala-tRNA(Pro) deacylase